MALCELMNQESRLVTFTSSSTELKLKNNKKVLCFGEKLGTNNLVTSPIFLFVFNLFIVTSVTFLYNMSHIQHPSYNNRCFFFNKYSQIFTLTMKQMVTKYRLLEGTHNYPDNLVTYKYFNFCVRIKASPLYQTFGE